MRLAVITFLTFVNTLSFGLFIPTFPFICRDLGGSLTIYGALVAIYPIFQFFSAPVLGSLSDRWGRRPVLMISYAGSLSGWMLFGLAWMMREQSGISVISLLLIALGRMLDGATAGNQPVLTAYLMDTSDVRIYVRNLGITQSGIGIGMILGPIISGRSYAAGYGMAGSALYGCGAMLIACCLILFLPDLKRARSGADSGEQKGIRFDYMNDLKESFREKKLACMFIGSLMFNIGLSAYNTTISPFVVERFHLPVSDISQFYNFVGIFLFLNQLLLVPIMSRHLTPLSLLASGILLMSAGFLALPQISMFSYFLLAYYPLNLGISLCFSSFRPVLVSFASKEIKGRVLGVESMMQATGTSIGPILGSMLYQSAGFRSFMIYAGIFPLVLFLTLRATVQSRGEGVPEAVSSD